MYRGTRGWLKKPSASIHPERVGIDLLHNNVSLARPVWLDLVYRKNGIQHEPNKNTVYGTCLEEGGPATRSVLPGIRFAFRVCVGGEALFYQGPGLTTPHPQLATSPSWPLTAWRGGREGKGPKNKRSRRDGESNPGLPRYASCRTVTPPV